MTKLLFFILLGYGHLTYKHTIAYNYFEQYKELAVVEMKRTGIPASIKLAQAALESKYGTSEFAEKTNNHFGIKCKTYWVGNTYYHRDDDLDNEGRLIKSCFRAYDAVTDSYVDHSNFLKHSIQYEHLFEKKVTDYKEWAIALQNFGYATDREYANKLLSIIKNYDLYRYDNL